MSRAIPNVKVLYKKNQDAIEYLINKITKLREELEDEVQNLMEKLREERQLKACIEAN